MPVTIDNHDFVKQSIFFYYLICILNLVHFVSDITYSFSLPVILSNYTITECTACILLLLFCLYTCYTIGRFLQGPRHVQISHDIILYYIYILPYIPIYTGPIIRSVDYSPPLYYCNNNQ